MMPSIFSLEEIDRTIFNTFRLKLVEYGYLPDCNAYPNDATGDLAYKAAYQAIKTGGKEIIEIFGVGNTESKDELASNTIVLDRDAGKANVRGMWETNVALEISEGVYNLYRLPSSTRTLNYSFKTTSSGAKYDRIITELFYEAFNLNTYPTWDSVAKNFNTSKSFEIVVDNDQDISIPEIFVRGFYIKVPDILVGTPNSTVSLGVVPSINEVTLEQEASGDDNSKLTLII